LLHSAGLRLEQKVSDITLVWGCSCCCVAGLLPCPEWWLLHMLRLTISFSTVWAFYIGLHVMPEGQHHIKLQDCVQQNLHKRQRNDPKLFNNHNLSVACRGPVVAALRKHR
jgi:hypothetical protein